MTKCDVFNRIITIDKEEPESESDELNDAGARTASYLQSEVEEATDTQGRLEQLRDYLWNKAMTDPKNALKSVHVIKRRVTTYHDYILDISISYWYFEVIFP